jgi:hypothetical protein
VKVSISSGAEPADEQAHVRAASRVSPGSASMRTYSVGTPMNTVASRHARDARPWGRTGQPDHLAAIEQRAVNGHEQAVHVEDRQRVDEHVAPRQGCQPQ